MSIKRMLSMIGVVVMVLTLCFPASAQEGQQQILSEMSDEELLAFLEEYEVGIPAQYEQPKDCLPFVRNIVEKLVENPNAIFAYGYVHLQDFADRIKAAVLAYYANTMISTFVYTSTPVNILVDSVVVGAWNDSYSAYNCYAYAIGLTEWQHPGDVVDNRHYDGPYLEDLEMPITENDFVTEACADLRYLGYDVVSYGTTRPTVSVNEHHRLICFRMESKDTGDFHFMVLEEDGSWYHKPGTTNPLRYLYEPSNDNPWRIEMYDGTYYYYDNERSYAGTIYYIEYMIPCEVYEYVYIGSGRHIQACSVCEQSKGYAAFCTYENGRCVICGSIEPIVQQSVPNAEEDC